MLTKEEKGAIATTYYHGNAATEMLPDELYQELVHGRNLFTFTPKGSKEDVILFFQ